MRGGGTLAYAAFDLLWLNGRDLRERPLRERKKRLDRLIPAAVGALNRVPCFEEEGSELFEAACGLDLEGIVAKRKGDPYAPETPWYKIKKSNLHAGRGAERTLRAEPLNLPWLNGDGQHGVPFDIWESLFFTPWQQSPA
jgi:ATP-dependent DNA ligase